MKQNRHLQSRLMLHTTIFAICGSLMLLGCGTKETTTSNSCDSDANYKLFFSATWSSKTGAPDFPDNAHFSPLIATTHSSEYTMWREAEPASNGMKIVAEAGNNTPLDEEIKTAAIQSKTKALFVASSGIKSSPGIGEVVVSASKAFSLLSVASMIAPSPDWFVGIDSHNLCVSDSWIQREEIKAYAWDSGTDSGETYKSDNSATDPVENISKLETAITKNESDATITYGTFVIEKQ